MVSQKIDGYSVKDLIEKLNKSDKESVVYAQVKGLTVPILEIYREYDGVNLICSTFLNPKKKIKPYSVAMVLEYLVKTTELRVNIGGLLMNNFPIVRIIEGFSESKWGYVVLATE